MARDLNDTLIFVKVVELGSFIAAARALRLPKTTVSRKVQELETRLGAQLLHRTTRKLGLTEAGNIYFDHCQRIARELDEAESAVGQLQGGPRGWLRFTAPYSAGVIWIAPLLGEFRARYPEVRVEMILTNETLDLIDKEIDVALRIGPLADSNLVARRLGQFRTQVYASADYLARHGEPLHPDDLQHHQTLSFPKFRRNGGYYWPLNDGERDVEYRIDPVVRVLTIGISPTLFWDVAGFWNRDREFSSTRFHHSAGAGIRLWYGSGVSRPGFRLDVAWDFDRDRIGGLTIGIEESFDLFGFLGYVPPGPYLPE